MILSLLYYSDLCIITSDNLRHVDFIGLVLTGIDPQWISSLRLKQMRENLTQERNNGTPSSRSVDSMTLPQFLSAFGNQTSYASAVRKSPNRSPLSPWASSRSSSPTLSTKLSSLQLGSKGSSPSSTTSESASERERPTSAGGMYKYPRNNYNNTVTGGGKKFSKGISHVSQGGARGFQHGGRPRTNSNVGPPHHPRIIPGMATVTAEKQNDQAEEAKSSEGGWIKVERKKPPKQDHKQQDQRGLRGRPRRGGRGGGRGRS